MAYDLQELLVDVYQDLGQLTVSTATGGSTTTIIDTKQIGEHGDDSWKDGAAFLVRDTGGAAPEGEMAFITDYTDSTGTFTSAASAWSASPASGDTFGFVNNFYPFHSMIEIANRALASLGEIPLVDTTTLDSATNQTEYTYAIAWKRSPPYRVDIQGRTNDANDNQWRRIRDWEYVPATAGSTALIVLPQLPTTRDIRIWYRGIHPVLSAATSTLYEGFSQDLIIAVVTEAALRWQNSRLQGGDDFLLQRWNDAKDVLEDAMAKYKMWKPPPQSKIFVLGDVVERDQFTFPDPA